MFLVTASEMQKMDRTTIETFGVPGRVLMENAGRGATVFFLETVYRHHPGEVGIAAGRGNNGGDGFVMARYLRQKGIRATVFLFAKRDRVAGDAEVNLRLLDAMDIPVVEIADETAFAAQIPLMRRQVTWIDAVLGTGLNSDVRGHFYNTIQFIKDQNRPVFAVDIASGLNADTGQICGICIEADATATFGFPKIGHIVYPGRECTGKLKVIEIGIPPHVAENVGCRQRLVSPWNVKQEMPRRPKTAHKGQTGHLLIIAGSAGKTGAAAMTATSAMRTGAGLVTLGIPKSLNGILETLVTEAMTVGLPETEEMTIDETAFETIVSHCKDKRCLAMGPGIGTHPATGRLLGRLMENLRLPMVLDADALNLIAKDPSILTRTKSALVLTPHPGEMARLGGHSTGEIQRDRVGHARAFAKKYGVHLVLKGPATIIAQPDETVYINPTGNPGMAAGGMGDVLTGLIAGLIVQGTEIGAAARTGVYLHGLAADILAIQTASFGYLATEVMNSIPRAMTTLHQIDGSGNWPIVDPLHYQAHGAES